jgi:hypothetical protein
MGRFETGGMGKGESALSTRGEDVVSQDVKPAEWKRPEIRLVGDVAKVVRGGGGKLSPTADDPGDYRKPSGQG